jgi:hypothetical protein
MCGRIIQVSGPLKLAIVDGLDVRESQFGAPLALGKTARLCSSPASGSRGVPPLMARETRALLPWCARRGSRRFTSSGQIASLM